MVVSVSEYKKLVPSDDGHFRVETMGIPLTTELVRGTQNPNRRLVQI